MSEWDKSYKPILQCNDPGEPPRLGDCSMPPMAKASTSTPATPGSASSRPEFRGVSDLRESAECCKSTTNVPTQ